MKESAIQKQIIEWLNGQPGVHAVRVPLGPMIQYGGVRVLNPLKGFPDIMGWLGDGQPFYIEVKGPAGRLSDKQKWWGTFFEERPVSVYMVASSLDQVITRFSTLISLTPAPRGSA